MSRKVADKKENGLLSILKGGIVSVAITLVLILIFALIIKFFNIKDNWIFPINQVIKVISLYVGVMIITKGNKEKGLVKGMLLGLLYFILSFVLFSILQGSFVLQISNVYDLLLTSLMGGILGLIGVHIGN